MLRKIAALAGVAAAQWAGTIGNMTTWGGDAPGAMVWFDSPAGAISGGAGSCDVSIAGNVGFVHFSNAHTSNYDGSGTWTVYAPSSWEDQGTYEFIYFADAEPAEGDVSVSCQNDVALAEGTPLLSSFPQAPDAESARGSLTAINHVFPSDVSMSFNAGDGPAGIYMDDPNLTASLVADDSWVISGMDSVNYHDVWFTMVYDNSTGSFNTVSAYDITIV